jgi:hypothetical protein
MSFYNYASSVLLLAIEEKPQAEIYFRYLTQLRFYYLHCLSIYTQVRDGQLEKSPSKY